ncbi:MAG: GNAT family N-acetyltransferase [Candidatus Omnitrophota bacterium]
MHIRSYQPQDSEGVKELISSIMGKEFAEEAKAYQYNDLNDISNAYGNLREKFIVAEEDGKIIGTVGIKEDGENTALLRRLFVHPSHRGREIGSMLIDTAEDFCKMNHFKEVSFRATSRMAAALKLLTVKKGFQEIQRCFFENLEIVILSYKLN